jgi:hypothetical protein
MWIVVQSLDEDMEIGNLHYLFPLFVVRFYVSYKLKKIFSMNERNEKVISVMETQLHLHYKKRLGTK